MRRGGGVRLPWDAGGARTMFPGESRGPGTAPIWTPACAGEPAFRDHPCPASEEPQGRVSWNTPLAPPRLRANQSEAWVRRARACQSASGDSLFARRRGGAKEDSRCGGRVLSGIGRGEHPPKRKAPPHPKMRRHPFLIRRDQPKLTAVLRRARIAPPIAPKPASIIAQEAGSGAGGDALSVPPMAKD